MNRTLSNLSKEDILNAMGLEMKRSGLASLASGAAVFAAGVTLGIGLGMLLAPKSGEELRGDLEASTRRGFQYAKDQVASAAGMVEDEAGSLGRSETGSSVYRSAT